jgi:ABC-type nitrate/sulfonate/bicarbonate transport system permease component
MTETSHLIAAALPFEGLAAATFEALASVAQTVDLPDGRTIYEAGTTSDDLYIVKMGAVRLEKTDLRSGESSTGIVRAGEAFGWTALARGSERRNRTVAIGAVSLLRIRGAILLDIITGDPGAGRVSRENIAAAIRAIQKSETENASAPQRHAASAFALFRIGQWLRSPKPYLMLIGYALLLGFWYLSVEVWKLPRFAEMPGLTTVFEEWLSPNPTYGVSVYTPVYYLHILVSLRRIALAFVLATAVGVPVGLLLGWSKTFKDYVFPIFEMIRPIPILAWVPLAIIMLPGSELPVLYLTFLASFFATALNTMLGVRSIDPAYVLAAKCLGASPWQVFWHVVVPGALPFIFTGLQISIGVAWFSLVAAEMVSGQFGLGYLINTSYTTVQYPTIVIAMITLGIVGYATSAAVRFAGEWLMGWRTRQVAMDGRR